MYKLVALLTVFAFALAARSSRADVKLPRMLGDHMVLQRNVEVPLWGTADAGREITVKLDGKVVATTKSGNDGAWSAKLPPTPAGGPHAIDIDQPDGKPAQIVDVLFGEVWVCSGQSNMEMPVSAASGAKEAIAAADRPLLRLLVPPHRAVPTPQTDIAASWQHCAPDAVKVFSAAAYYFGLELSQKLNVPIGLIDSSWGATSAEPWTSRDGLLGEPDFKPAVLDFDRRVREYDEVKAKALSDKRLADWNEAAAKAKAEGKPPPPDKPYYVDERLSPWGPANIFNGMIAPLTHLPVAGAIWYQGESNVGRGAEYRVLLPALIKSWRTAWASPDMPFYFVQIAPYAYKGASGAPCAELWESQLLTMKNVPHTGMAVITDVGEIKEIHPRNKATVGHRLALWALSQTYHQDLPCSGPVYKSFTVEADKIRLSFDHAGSGLSTRDGAGLTDFTIAGDDQKFYPATATIDGDAIVVHCDNVPHPAAVRFGWREDAQPNFINKDGLPASPFRTDNWRMVTQGNIF